MLMLRKYQWPFQPLDDPQEVGGQTCDQGITVECDVEGDLCTLYPSYTVRKREFCAHQLYRGGLLHEAFRHSHVSEACQCAF